MAIIHNSGPSRPAVRGHRGLKPGKNRHLSEQTVEAYKETFPELFEEGQLEELDEGEAPGQEAPGDEYELGDENHMSLKADIEEGVYDDRLSEIIENDERSTVVEKAEERQAELG